MDDVNFFDNIDLKEVSKRTLIDLKELSYLKDEEFDKLSKTKGLGFIKIIEREYKVDLSDKREKFLEYLKEHNKDNSNELFIAPPKTPSKIFPKFFALLLVFLIVLGALYIFYLNSLSNNSAITELKPDNNPIVQEAKKISGIDINGSNEQNTTDEQISDETKNEENITTVQEGEEKKNTNNKNKTTFQAKEAVEQNLSDIVKEVNTSTKNIDNKKSIQPPKEEQINAVAPVKSITNSNQENNTTSNLILTIVPKKRIWVGIIDLSNYKKSSYIKDSNITISKNSDFLIATGHGKFDIYYNDQVIKFDTVNPIRLFVKDGKVVKIDKTEFVKLNRGKYW